MQKMRKEKGITLLVLVITIIILLILAGITISAITGDNGIIKNAGQAKEETKIANEKEIVEKATVQAMGNNKYGNIEENELQSELDKETGEGKTEATDIGEEFEVVFIDSNRYYTVDKDGNVGEAQDIIKDKNPGDITTGKDGETLDGSEEHPYEIWCIEDLIEWSQNYNKYVTNNITLCRNLNFKSKLSYENSEDIKYGDINKDNKIESIIEEMQTGVGFLPIETFKGVFDGNYYQIKNILIKQELHAGFIKGLGGGRIKNLSLSGILEASNDIGGIAANGGGIIENCHVNIKINTSKETNMGNSGGIIGVVTGYIGLEIRNCSSEGEIKGNNAGGIVGWCWTTGDLCNISNSYNLADISGSSAGGIIGGNSYAYHTKVYNCLNLGKLNGNSVGGIVGNCGGTDSEKVQIYNSYYLNNVEKDVGNSSELQAVKFDIKDLKGQIDKLNQYIENSDEIDTSLWKKWNLKDEIYPIFE